jgi:hypothetical protein
MTGLANYTPVIKKNAERLAQSLSGTQHITCP